MWRTLDTGRAGAVGVGVTIDPQGSINRHARAQHVPATESGLCGGQLVRLARRQPPRRHGQPRRRAQRNDDQSDILPKLRSVPFERAAHGPMTQRHARDTERAARNEAAGRAAMATGASGRSVRLAAAVEPRCGMEWGEGHRGPVGGRGAAPMILLANPGAEGSVKQRRTWPNSMSEAVVPEAPEAPWFPRPRGAAPHGPGGVPKKWNHATGSWESHPAAACLLHESSAAPRLVPRPRGAVREPDRTFPRLAIDPFLFPENSRAKETPLLLLPPVAGAVPEFPFAANSSPSLRGALACVRAVSA